MSCFPVEYLMMDIKSVIFFAGFFFTLDLFSLPYASWAQFFFQGDFRQAVLERPDD